MAFDTKEIGNHIARLRKSKGLTQNELGDRLYVSFQAVSKWERGESMPDISLLPDLASALETTIDNILSGGKKMTSYTKKITVKDAKEAIDCVGKIGKLLGKDNAFYIGAVEGINAKMNIELEEYVNDEYSYEALVAEAIIQCVNCGYYVDISDVNREFKNQRWAEIVKKYADNAGIK